MAYERSCQPGPESLDLGFLWESDRGQPDGLSACQPGACGHQRSLSPSGARCGGGIAGPPGRHGEYWPLDKGHQSQLGTAKLYRMLAVDGGLPEIADPPPAHADRSRLWPASQRDDAEPVLDRK